MDGRISKRLCRGNSRSVCSTMQTQTTQWQYQSRLSWFILDQEYRQSLAWICKAAILFYFLFFFVNLKLDYFLQYTERDDRLYLAPTKKARSTTKLNRPDALAAMKENRKFVPIFSSTTWALSRCKGKTIYYFDLIRQSCCQEFSYRLSNVCTVLSTILHNWCHFIPLIDA